MRGKSSAAPLTAHCHAVTLYAALVVASTCELVAIPRQLRDGLTLLLIGGNDDAIETFGGFRLYHLFSCSGPVIAARLVSRHCLLQEHLRLDVLSQIGRFAILRPVPSLLRHGSLVFGEDRRVLLHL